MELELLLLDRPVWSEEDLMPSGGEPHEQPVYVRYDIRDVLRDIQRGVDSANSSLALKADKKDLDEVKHDVALLKESVARSRGWRDGFIVAATLAVALIAGLALRVVGAI